MRPILIVLVVVALAIAGATAYLANRFLAEQEAKQEELAKAPPPMEVEEVLVAARPIASGTVLVEDDLDYQQWPAEAVPENLIVRAGGSDPKKDYVGAIAGDDFAANEPIPSAALLRQDQASQLTVRISPGMEAFTIKIDPLSSVAGFVGPGDHVDVLLTRTEPVETPQGEHRLILTERVLKDARVLAIGRRTGGGGAGGENATLEVTPRQAEMLAVAARMGDLTLVLGSMIADTDEPLIADTVDDADAIMTSLHVSQAHRRFNRDVALALFPELGGVERPMAPQPVVRQAPERAGPVPQRASVKVTLNRGGVASTRTFVRSGN